MMTFDGVVSPLKIGYDPDEDVLWVLWGDIESSVLVKPGVQLLHAKDKWTGLKVLEASLRVGNFSNLLQLIEAVEGAQDLADYRKAKAEIGQEGTKPLSQFKQELEM
ncbi:MAG: hypothetical protein HC840_13075 [Leptolyngbyaceae cyanobacterium RM2_2_4]|nr:hypothetical protein [Leptolyngbyaceae cyanobacterium SL_5_14]NJO50211.1 hypothetical protein [Leptolyngbyaceae cyanobacterium RM2_2_4]NJO67292.1 hypothetical protein [Leptolyngbyaceae cyanobacterium RM1_405_57]